MVKRKVFIKTDISTARVEHYKSDSGAVVIPLKELPPTGTVVRFNAGFDGGGKSFDFAAWYGVGIDQIVYACQKQIERFVDGQDAEVSKATIQGYCQGLSKLLTYLSVLSAARRRELTLADIEREVIDGFLGFLADEDTARLTQKNKYTFAKAVLRALCDRGIIQETRGGDNATFPRNPFPGVQKGIKGERPLSKAERQAFSVAVKSAVMPIFSDDVEATSDLLTYALLVIALHTGRNTWPLLEMTSDCLRSHPKKDTLFLVVYKRRGHSTSKTAIRADRADAPVIESMPTVRPTVVALIKRVIELSSHLRQDAPEAIKKRIWLFRRRRAGKGSGGIGTLTPNTLSLATEKLVREQRLVDRDGKPLRINVGRLRKTFVNRIYEILDGDVVGTSVAAGNTVEVASQSYLRPGEEAQRNWKFMGMALVQELLTKTIGATERTPVGQCSDNRNGEYSPKRDGAVCMNFFNCLRCRNYVVTGDDLHRLYSFYWRILRERSRISVIRWKRQFAHIVRLIERDVAEAGVKKGAFKQALVDRERERARTDPHPFWSSDTIIADLAGAPF